MRDQHDLSGIVQQVIQECVLERGMESESGIVEGDNSPFGLTECRRENEELPRSCPGKLDWNVKVRINTHTNEGRVIVWRSFPNVDLSLSREACEQFLNAGIPAMILARAVLEIE
jgi:hypothetical protein